MLGASLFALTIWIASEPNFGEWITLLEVHVYFIGIYVLLIAAIVVMLVSFLGCCSALMEHTLGLGVVSSFNMCCRYIRIAFDSTNHHSYKQILYL